jgi:ribosomal protein S18 acetylase RimI-like enzyme
VLEDDCRARGVLRIFLETERPNARARSLYARHGYTKDDSIWMSKEL